MMKKCIRQELTYFKKTKLIYIILAVLAVSSISIIYYNCKSVLNDYNSYEKLVKYYEKNNLNLEEDLNSDYELQESGEYDENGYENIRIDNPLKYYYESFQKKYYVVSNEYVMEQYFEYGLMIFPIVFTIIGIISSTYDRRNKTIKIKAARFGKANLFFSKQITMAGTSVFVIIVSALLNIPFGDIIRKQILKEIDVNDLNNTISSDSSNIIIQILVAIIISFIFLQIGYLLGLMLDNALIGTIAIFVYVMFVPILGKYDLKSIIYGLSQKTYSFMGSYVIRQKISLTYIPIVIGLFAYSILIYIVSLIVSNKKSAFV